MLSSYYVMNTKLHYLLALVAHSSAPEAQAVIGENRDKLHRFLSGVPGKSGADAVVMAHGWGGERRLRSAQQARLGQVRTHVLQIET